MNFFRFWIKNNSNNTTHIHVEEKENPVNHKDFLSLSEPEQREVLKRGAKKFSKNFTEVITQLANE